MCGIYLLLKLLEHIDIQTELNKIKHRGPDNSALQIIDNMAFGFHRLSIINPLNDDAMQPFEEKDIVLLCNGEIYNYRELYAAHFKEETADLKVDIEIIHKLYIKYGIEKTIKMLDGDFAFILYDKSTQMIYTGRDPIGLKPLYFGYKNNELIAISSEIKAITNYCDQVNEHDIGAFTTIHNNTLITSETYFNFIENIQPNVAEADIKINIQRLLAQSVNKRIDHTDRPYAFLCSGGLDSSLILALAVEKLGCENVHAFSLELKNSHSEDTFYAKLLTTQYNVKHTIIQFSKEEGLSYINEIIQQLETYDVNTIRASIPMYIMAKWIKENTDYTVIFSGEGADELFMGYLYFNYFKQTPAEIIASNNETCRLLSNMHCFDVLRAERCFSCNGLELRVPFLDKEFMEYVLTIDGRFKQPRNGVEKYILRESFKYLDKIPSHILSRQKEKMSDGIGFGWVNAVMDFCKSKNSTEKEYFAQIFDTYYPNRQNVIIPRELPTLITDHVAQQQGAGLMM